MESSKSEKVKAIVINTLLAANESSQSWPTNTDSARTSAESSEMDERDNDEYDSDGIDSG